MGTRHWAYLPVLFRAMETELSRIFILLSDSIAADDWEGVMTTNSCKPNLRTEITVVSYKNRKESTP